MSDINRVFLSGRLTHDPEIRYTASGTPVARLSIAVNRWIKDKNDQFQRETMFINDISAWERLAEKCRDLIKKGDWVFIDGRLRVDEWEDKQGNKRKVLKIVAWDIQTPYKKKEEEIEPPPVEPMVEPIPPEDEVEGIKDDMPF